jgi:predicted esterase
LTDGDYRLRIEVLLRDKPLVCREQGLSFVTNASERIGGLKRDLNAFPSAPRHTDKETGQALFNLLQSLYEGGTEETDVPAAHFLKEAEGIVKTAKTGKTFYGSRKEGQFWLTLPTGQRMTMVRLLAPEAVKEGRSLPLVIALHGLGGSEHLFFEGYGRGTMVRLCQQRSWLLVAPRLDFLKGPLPMREMIAEVNRLYPIDRKRIFLVGHSMGARESVAQLERAPKDFAGVAVLAGGGPLREPQALKNLPFFIGVGQEDPVPLAPGWAYKLEKDLKKAGMEILIFKEYKDIEHLLVVQAALPDIFALFDRVGKP